jgi:hypothetical protein
MHIAQSKRTIIAQFGIGKMAKASAAVDEVVA